MGNPDIGQRMIVATGDVTVDWNLARAAVGESQGAMAGQTTLSSQGGGALLLAEVLESMVEGSGIQVMRPSTLPDHLHPGDPRYHHSYAVWDQFPPDAWRVDEFLGIEHAISSHRDGQAVQSDAGGSAELVVIDDAALGFRDDPSSWPSAVTNPTATSAILLSMASPLATGELWHELYRHHLDRLAVIVSVDALREMDVQISRGLSWERTALDLAWELLHNPRVNALAQARTLVVTLGTAGAFLLERRRGRQTSKLIFDPAVLEGEWRRNHPGSMIGLTSVMTASLAGQLVREKNGESMAEAVRRGIGAMRALHERGYDATSEDGRVRLAFPAKTITRELKTGVAGFAVVGVPDPGDIPLDIAAPIQSWTILEDTQASRIDELAVEIVERGIHDALDDVPVGRFGFLVTIDRREIESFRSIRTLIAEYAGQRQSRPLSMAVFGAPGAGKSFGVTQVAESVLPGQIEVLTFNLSQFDDPSELLGALHQVRDVGLSGKLPLVFWDEFDAALGDRPYGWLRTFLAPMQDGSFLEGQIEHPIGRAIFVFAGGTASRMQHFGEMVDAAAFRGAKGPDFLSRLKGYVNVMGPDPQADNGSPGTSGDPTAVIRRAILLRSILERNASQVVQSGRVQIDPGVLRGFLHTTSYKHGVRSMESIVAMSTLTGRTRYERSSLPPEAQLDLHVDCRDFMANVQLLELEGQLLERLAEEAHNAYRELGLDTPYADLDYSELPEEAKGQNRAVVRDIPNRLAAIGHIMLPARAQEEPSSIPEESLERLARMEHERYVRERLAQGWRYGEERNDRLRTHPALVYWHVEAHRERELYTTDEQARLGPGPLPEDEKEKDRALMRAIPRILARAGYIAKMSRDV